MTKLSLCLITKDEEKNIGACLESAREIVDEIILVDTGSKDSTVEIAAGYGAKVFHHMWRDNFAVAKNETLKHATGDWILALDADERLSGPNRNKIRHLLENPSHNTYLLQLRCPYGSHNKPQGITTALAIRLFQNRIGLRYYGRIHERVRPRSNQESKNTANTNIVIDHIGYQVDLTPKYLRNLAISRRQKRKHDAFSRYDMARMQMGLDHLDEAEKQLHFGLKLPNSAAWLRAQMHVLLGDLAAFKHQDESYGMASWRQAAETDPNMVAPRLRMGRFLYRNQEYGAAIEQFQKIVRLLYLGSLRGVVVDDECPISEAYASLAACYAKCGRREEAADVLILSRTSSADVEELKLLPWQNEDA